MMQKYIIFSNFWFSNYNILREYRIIIDILFFSLKSLKFLYLCRIFLRKVFNSKKWCIFAGLIANRGYSRSAIGRTSSLFTIFIPAFPPNASWLVEKGNPRHVHDLWKALLRWLDILSCLTIWSTEKQRLHWLLAAAILLWQKECGYIRHRSFPTAQLSIPRLLVINGSAYPSDCAHRANRLWLVA